MFQADIPTCMGVGPGASPSPEAMETDKDSVTPAASNKKYYIDSTYLYTPRENMEIQSPLKDGLSECVLSIAAGTVELWSYFSLGLGRLHVIMQNYISSCVIQLVCSLDV